MNTTNKKIGTRLAKLLHSVYNSDTTIPKPVSGKEAIASKMTLNDIIAVFEEKRFTFPEEYQRGQVTSWSKFGRQWVTTLFGQDGFSHYDKLHILREKTENGANFLQVVEGGQRLRAISDFFINHRDDLRLGGCVVNYRGTVMNLSGLTARNLSDLAKVDPTIAKYYDSVKNRHFDVSEYRDYDGVEIANIFCKINQKTPLNDQELRNPFGGTACVAIRKTARHDAEPHKQYSLHPLFEVVKSKNGYQGRWMKINPARYEYEKMLAELLLFENNYEDANFSISKSTLDNFYHEFQAQTQDTAVNKKIDAKFNALHKKTLARLTTIYNMVKMDNAEKNTGMILTKGNLFALYGLLYHIETRYLKKFKVEYVPRTFFKWFWKNHVKMSKTAEIDPVTKKHVESAYGLKVRKASRNKEEIECIFSYWQNLFKDLTVDGLTDAGIIIKDTSRTLNDQDKLTVYVNQDLKDAVTGKERSIDDLHKGHIVAHADGLNKGGSTTVKNTVLLNGYDNLKQGSKSFEDYVKNVG